MKIKLLATLFLSIFIFTVIGCTDKDENEISSTENNLTKLKKIGIMTYVSHEILDTILDGIMTELKRIGYSKDQIVIYNANGEMDKVHSFAKEMTTSNFDVLIPITTPVSQAVVKSAKGKIPVVYSFVSDPNSVGVKSKTEKPHNVTGISDIINYHSNLKLIRDLLPNSKKIGMIYNSGESNSVLGIKQCRLLAEKFHFKIEEVSVVSTAEVLNAARMIADKIDAFYVIGDNTVVGAIASVIKVGREKMIPVFASDSGSVQLGACAAFSVNYKKFGKVTAEIADRVLNGDNINAIEPLMYEGNSLIVNKSALSFFNVTIPTKIISNIEEEF